MTQFLSFVADSVHTPLTVGSKGLLVLPEQELPSFIERFKNKPKEGYYSMFSYQGDTPKTFQGIERVMKLTLDLVALDFDSPDEKDLSQALSDVKGVVTLFGLKPDQYAIFESGRKGFHLYFPKALVGSCVDPCLDLNDRILRFAESLKDQFKTTDLSVFKKPQKFRLPFSLHGKPPHKPKRLIEGSWPLDQNHGLNTKLFQAFISSQMSRPELEVLDSSEQEQSAFMTEFDALKNKACVSGILADEKTVPKGEKHRLFMNMVSDLYNSGHTTSEIREKLKPWASRNNPSERWDEFESHIKDLTRGRKNLGSGCKDKVRAKHCSAKCPLYPKLSAETLADRSVPKDADQKTKKVTEDKTALVVIKKFATSIMARAPIVHISESNAMYHFDGEKYEEVKPIFFKALLEQAMPSFCDRKKSDELVATIQRRTTTPHRRLQQAADKYINFKNGHFNKETGELEPRLSARFFTYCLPFDYNEKALAPRFEQFLAEVTSGPDRPNGDKDLASILLEFMGYTFSGDEQWAQQALFMLGEGHNGKSKLIDLITYMVGGDENFSSMPLEMLSKPERLPALENKLGNLVSEENEGSFRSYSSQFKALCTSDSLTARRLHGEPYQIKSRAKMWVSTNNAPQTNDTSHGFMKRMLFIPFDARMLRPEEMSEMLALNSGALPVAHYLADLQIVPKLQAEAAGVFNMAWKAYKAAKERGGFTQAKISRAMKDEFTEDSSSIRFVIANSFELQKESKVHYSEIKEHFVTRAKALGSWAGADIGQIRKEIQRIWPNLTKVVKSNGKNWISGIRIVSNGDDPARNTVLGSGIEF